METKISLKEIIVLIFTSFLTLTIFSKSSFLYPLNNWVDANCYFTVGKSILNGFVPYKDFVDHKGLLLYFIQMIGAAISYTSFVGVYILEILSSFFFLFFSLKGIRLFTDKHVIILFPIIALLIYSSITFASGNSAEEFCLPFIAHAFYIGLKYTKNKSLVRNQDILFVGLGMGCVFWIKFNLIGVYIGLFFYLFALMLANKYYKKAGIYIGMFFIGFLLVTLPIIVYTMVTDSFSDMFDIYFYKNIFTYNRATHQELSVGGIIHQVLGRTKYGVVTNPITALLIGVAFIVFLKYTKSLLLLFCGITSMTCSFCMFNTFDYYYLVWAVFVPYSLIIINNIISKHTFSYSFKNSIIILLTIAVGIFSYKRSPNNYMFLQKKTSLPQYQFKEIICKKKSPKVLNEGMDLGVYTVTGLIPPCRYFCYLNIDKNLIFQEHQTIIKNKGADYIVKRGKPIHSPNYALIKQIKGDNGMGHEIWFYLYKRY